MSTVSPVRRKVIFQSDEEAVTYLYGLRRRKIKLGLDNIRYLLDYLDHPESKFPSIHIAGTNGKGSTSAMLESILRAAGYRTGLLTSPHLVSFRERIRVDGNEIPMAVARTYLETLVPVIEEIGASFFETITAMAFAYFHEREVDVAVLEVGMGGRLDATNVVYPELAVITEIDFDHERHLGKTLAQIAGEKAGIVKPGVPTVLGSRKIEVLQVFEEICRLRNSGLISILRNVRVEDLSCTRRSTHFTLVTPSRRWTELEVALLGAHQVQNAALAVLATEQLDNSRFDIPLSAVYEGLCKVRWPGRMQVLRRSPFVVADVAHNPQSAHVVCHEMKRLFPHRNFTVVFGVLRDKNYRRMIELMNHHVDRYVAVAPHSERALPAAELAQAIQETGKEAVAAQTISEGIRMALEQSGSKDLIGIVGSHFIMEDVFRFFGKSVTPFP